MDSLMFQFPVSSENLNQFPISDKLNILLWRLTRYIPNVKHGFHLIVITREISRNEFRKRRVWNIKGGENMAE